MKQKNVFFKVICAAIIVMAVFSSCMLANTEDREDQNNTGYFKLKTTGLKSLYVSDMQVQSGNRAVGDNPSLQTLTYINAAGQNSPVYFISPSGKTIVLEVNEFERVDDQRTFVNFNSFYEVSEIKTEVNGQSVTAYVLGDSQYYWYDDKGNSHEVYDSRALIDWSSGKVYDFKDQGYVLFAQDGNLYTYISEYDVKYLRNSTIYKIDLNTLSNAVPLNNPSFYPINDGLYPPIVLNNKIISLDLYSFDINQSVQPQQVKLATVTIGNQSYPIEFGSGLLIQDLEGTYWYFNLYGGHPGGYNYNDHIGMNVQNIWHWDPETHEYVYDYYWDYSHEPYIVCKPAIDDTGQMSVSEPINGTISFPTGPAVSDVSVGPHQSGIFFLDPGESGIAKMIKGYRSGRFYDVDPLVYRNNGVFILFKNGFVSIRKKAQGLQVDSTALSIPALSISIPSNLHYWNCFINKDNYLYWLEGAAIKRLYLGTGGSAETVYSNSRIISSSVTDKILLTASGSNLIFYTVAEDNISVHTYSLPMYQPGAVPKILSTSDVQVRDIVELNF